MTSTLLAVLLITASGKETNLVFHWPPHPASSLRLGRPKPPYDTTSQADKFWLYATNAEADTAGTNASFGEPDVDERDYEWKRPNTFRERARSHSFADSSGRSRPNSRRTSPSKDVFDNDFDEAAEDAAYNNLFGYQASFLASILCPKDDLCHQKFELIVDDLAFIGHPVCSESDGIWRFKTEKQERRRRGRGSRNQRAEPAPAPDTTPATIEENAEKATETVSTVQTFHVVLVIDLPDPSSSASGNLFKYFHIIYEQLAFTMTAVLFQEQVLSRYVDKECEILYALRESCIRHSRPYNDFCEAALQDSSLARCLRTLYDSVKSNQIARLMINEIGVEVQLPPQLDKLLDSAEEDPDYVEHEDPDSVSWGPELSFGWGLPSLAPWKSLLLYDLDEEHHDLKANINRPGMSQEDQELAEELILFLETVSIFDSLATVADSLNWDLERKVYPTVRWLVYHRRAKIVDTVHGGLRTLFALPSKMDTPLGELSEEFAKAFPQNVPPLPKLFAAISNANTSATPYSPSGVQNRELGREERIVSTENHFFATVVKSKDLLPLYRDVVVWLLKRDLLVVLHLHVRIVASPRVKKLAFLLDERRRSKKSDMRNGRRSRIVRPMSSSRLQEFVVAEVNNGSPFRPGTSVPNYTRDRGRRHSSKSATRGLDRPIIYEEREDNEAVEDQADQEDSEESDIDWEEEFIENELPSIIYEPAQATKIQRKWIEAMSDGKDRVVAERFKQIHQYFDGKRTDDEILCRAKISRRQLKEVLLHYEEHLLMFLHPG